MTRGRILIVENEAIVQEHLRKVLTELGYEICGVAATSSEALKVAAEERPDLALVDIHLDSKRDGVDTARELRSRHGVGVVFLTAFADEATVERTREVGPVGYMVKPFTSPEMRAVLSTALAEHQRYKGVEARSRSLESALGVLGDGIIVTNHNAAITFMNPQASALTGWSVPDAEGRPLAEVLRSGAGSEPTLDGTVERALARRESPAFANAGITTRDGARRSLHGEVEYLDDVGAGSGPGLVVVMRDAASGDRVERSLSEIRETLREGDEFCGIVGSSPPMVRVFAQIKELARVDWNVLIEGETGVGKELVARAIHAMSERKDQPLVAVNCAGLTDTLLGSQLFGHKRGAFTGAVEDQKGVFEAASGGTLFLDEIGDVSRDVQAALLRVLEDKNVTAIGDTRPRTVDTRLIAATQRHLSDEVRESRFRADLLFRLRVARIVVPPLRERPEDIPRLAAHFLAGASADAKKNVRQFSGPAMKRLTEYAWPGNVRELKSAVASAVLACRTPTIDLADLPAETGGRAEAGAGMSAAADERERILNALSRSGGNRTRAARLLGVSRATFYRRLNELGIRDT